MKQNKLRRKRTKKKQITMKTKQITIKTEQKLDSGVYTLEYLGYPDMRVKIDVSTDRETIKSYTFPDKDKLDNLFESFFNKNVVQ